MGWDACGAQGMPQPPENMNHGHVAPGYLSKMDPGFGTRSSLPHAVTL